RAEEPSDALDAEWLAVASCAPLARPAPTSGAGDTDAWDTLASILGQVGAPMTLQQLCDLTGLPKSTISMALRRRADAAPPGVVRLKQGLWSLPAYKDVPYLE